MYDKWKRLFDYIIKKSNFNEKFRFIEDLYVWFNYIYEKVSICKEDLLTIKEITIVIINRETV